MATLNWTQPTFGEIEVFSELIISQIEPSHVGEYVCTAYLSGYVSNTTTIPPLHGTQHTVRCLSIIFSLAVVLSDVVITRNPSGTLYSGTSVTLTCTATLNYGVNYDGVAANIFWGGISPTLRYSITNAVEGSDDWRTSSLTINPLAYQDSGTFACTVTVSGEKIQPSNRTSSYHHLEISEYRGTLSFVQVFCSFFNSPKGCCQCSVQSSTRGRPQPIGA